MSTDLGFALASLFSKRCRDDPDADNPMYSHTRKCAVCGETTREGKEFCTNHVENHSYIKDLMSRMHARDEEDHKVMMEGSAAVNYDGVTVQEIMIHLRQTGTKTIDGLSKALSLDKTVIQKYVFALRDRNQVEIFSTQRESMAVRLLGNAELFGEEDCD
ncbi:hypothetical protein C4588_08060 [Candidatus Parcubacteria bacterium]|nr:MAG: hypothetical protein C4588_08060 [Candidatus Parcubacteria bacterium]